MFIHFPQQCSLPFSYAAHPALVAASAVLVDEASGPLPSAAPSVAVAGWLPISRSALHTVPAVPISILSHSYLPFLFLINCFRFLPNIRSRESSDQASLLGALSPDCSYHTAD